MVKPIATAYNVEEKIMRSERRNIQVARKFTALIRISCLVVILLAILTGVLVHAQDPCTFSPMVQQGPIPGPPPRVPPVLCGLGGRHAERPVDRPQTALWVSRLGR